jgi:hypothetical protein
MLGKNQQLILLTIADYFSFAILLRTLFQPWKRDTISTEHLSLQERFEVWGLNLVARLVGAVIRGATIIAGSFVLLTVIGLFWTLWLVWLTAPLLALGLIILGTITMSGGLR